ncbi:RIP metalloprotease RseP [Alkaliphilus transvaalensis]|uniref:RIP metalloprotease RseP n=1 Tax=Alkaliphilus transvaalensis TaxID=114628 RepID=UPI00047B40D1|nr:RIP metalloprotease RseP [Alkaliphilus transvaalensis]
MQTALAAIIVFGIAIFIHELGHFGVAKLVGIKVHEFALGMGPKLIQFTSGETAYTLRALPIGGYVKMEGEDEASEDERSFNKKPALARIGVIFAGPIMNFLLGLLLFTMLFYTVGVPTTTIQQVISGSPAEVMDIQPGDSILSVNGQKTDSWGDLESAIGGSTGGQLEILLRRNGEEISKIIEPMVDAESGRIMIGIVPSYERNLGGAIRNSFNNFRMIIREIMSFLRRVVVREATTDEVAGPVGIIHLVGEATRAGWLNVLFLAGLININLGLMNLLPIPALDGSRLLFLIAEVFRGKPVDPDKEGMIHMVGFTVLIGLMIFVTYQDIVRIFN